MFGCCVAGRLLQTNLQQVDETHAYFELPNASTMNHLTVFLLGTVPFPDGYGATVHFYWPGKGFQVLGMLSNEKPSAIFRLRGSFIQSSASSATHTAFSSASIADTSADVTAVLGLAIEPLAQIQAQLAQLPSTVAKPAGPTPDPTLLAERIVKNLFNYVSGFVEGSGGVTPELSVPMNIIVKWYESFMNKMRVGGVGFLERGD
ncbi:hypothetical protein DXG03_007563 [Asterophora parasitica]|uniref:Hikeshi-like domain-containing protein n=1 Tax=Asterophora parasitica TaxID=117018 RepID=A0A9P7KEI1_9AGAR|nr:hypothetical protein DXG03_007563 [Asterophora parasitica]